MQIELHMPVRPLANVHVRTYDPELDDVRSILTDVCDLAGQQSQFLVSGFGQHSWPVDAKTDLVVLLEQLPEALIAVSESAPFEIDFYEQGIERKVVFSPEGNRYTASCFSYGKFKPNPAIHHIDRDSLSQMLTSVRDEFVRFMRSNCPGLLSHPWMRDWLLRD